MNEYELFLTVLFKKKLRNAFIYPNHWIEHRKEDERMKTKIAAIILAVITVTSLGLAVGFVNASTMMGQNSMAATVSSRPVQASWVRINGVITKWGTTDVRGLLNVQARTALLNNADTRQLAQAGAVWTTNISRAISTVRSKENFTYTFYAARLMNASVSTLSYGASNFFINGTWNVYKVQSNVTIITDSDGNIVHVHRDSNTDVSKAYGELNVTDNWTKFKLQLTGYDPLTGSVTRSITRQMQFNMFKVADDAAVSNVVTKADFAAVVKCYRAMPGWGNYDNAMDFNSNYRIDIADLSTVAANM
jgi:hypothetical protein